jgi:hypothetical protein
VFDWLDIVAVWLPIWHGDGPPGWLVLTGAFLLFGGGIALGIWLHPGWHTLCLPGAILMLFYMFSEGVDDD